MALDKHLVKQGGSTVTFQRLVDISQVDISQQYQRVTPLTVFSWPPPHIGAATNGDGPHDCDGKFFVQSEDHSAEGCYVTAGEL